MPRQQANLLLVLVAAAACGGFSVLGWAPFAWWPLALLGYAALYFLLLRERSIARAVGLGLAFGAGLHATGHGWIFSALHQKVGLGWISAALGTAFFVVYLALCTAVPCGLFMLLRARRSLTPLLLAASFAGLLSAGEYARSLFFNGFTSLSLGYALVDTWLAALGTVAGVYLVSWAGFFCAAWAVHAVHGAWPQRLSVAAGVCAMAAASAWLSGIVWVQPMGSPLGYRLLQVNVPQQRKFAPAYVQEQVQHLVRVIEQEPADLIVTPETAFPQFLDQLPEGVLARLQAFGQDSRSHLLLGIATTAADSKGYNSVLHLSPSLEGPAIAQYHKVRLMPFGEYSPWGFGWFTKMLAISLKDLSAGAQDQAPFRVGPQRLGMLICNEDLVGDDALRAVGATGGASILVNPGNLAWFEGSLAIEQRLQIVRMRALEVGRPILRVANTGVTAHIDPTGRVVARLAADMQGVLSGQVQGVEGLTPYGRIGDVLYWCLLGLGFGAALASSSFQSVSVSTSKGKGVSMQIFHFRRKQRGQGMTEYIVIVALIAVAAIAVYQFFGQTIRSQTAGIAKEVSGQSASADIQNSQTAATAATAEGTKKKGLDAYTNDNSR